MLGLTVLFAIGFPNMFRKVRKQTKLDELMENATKMMEEAGKASKTHTKYLKILAADKGIDISSDDTSD